MCLPFDKWTESNELGGIVCFCVGIRAREPRWKVAAHSEGFLFGFFPTRIGGHSIPINSPLPTSWSAGASAAAGGGGSASVSAGAVAGGSASAGAGASGGNVSGEVRRNGGCLGNFVAVWFGFVAVWFGFVSGGPEAHSIGIPSCGLFVADRMEIHNGNGQQEGG